MLHRLYFLMACIFVSFSGNTQTFEYKKLSNSFNFEVSLLSTKQGYTNYITIAEKKTKKLVQCIEFQSYFSFPIVLDDKNACSYSTGFNKNLKVEENDYGYIVVADFNFDQKEDFAVISDLGGNGGPTYDFYIQKNGKFVLDDFLTDKMHFFPKTINPSKKTLTTIVRATTMEYAKTTYQYDAKLKTWKEIKRVYF